MAVKRFFYRYPHLIYLVVLLLTALLWLGISLSDHRVFPVTFRVVWDGVDTNRYVTVHADREVTFDIQSNGFLALARARSSRRFPMHIQADYDTIISNTACCRMLMRQFGFQGVHNITCRTPLQLTLKPRYSKAFHPDVSSLSVSFAEPYAIYGTPTVEPDTVWLYGSSQSLDKIKKIAVKPTFFPYVRETRTFKVPLEPVWEQYPDLRISHRTVSVTIPTERYSERTFEVPIKLDNAPSSMNVRLYPTHVRLTVWAAEKDQIHLNGDQFGVQVTYHPSADRLPVTVSHFPSHVRIRSVEPEEVSCVIIKP